MKRPPLSSPRISKSLQIVRFSVLAAVCWAHSSGTCNAATTNPVIFNHSKSVSPGQIVGIQGANFGANPEVWIDQITGDADTPNPETQLTNIVNKSDTLLQGSYVAAEIPTSVPMGLYAIFVKNTTTGLTSAHKFVNRASASMALDLAGMEIDPSRTFRLMGTNLNFPSTGSSVKFRKPDNTTLPATFPNSQPNDPYLLTLIAPAGITAGVQYEIIVNNGYGGTTHGDVATGIFLTGRAGGTDYWNLGVPWAAELTFHNNTYDVTSDPRLSSHADPADNATDDRPAIQDAINKAHLAGGGRVFLPAGTYNIISSNLTVTNKQRIVIQGAGKELTKIYANAPLNGYILTGFGGNDNLSHFGLADLGFECGPSGPTYIIRAGSTQGKYFFIARCKFYNHGISACGTTSTLIQDSDIYGSLGLRHKDVLVRRNYIQWKSGRHNFYSDNADQANPYCLRLQFDANTFRRSVLRPPSGPQCGGLSLGGAKSVAILGNVFNRLESDPSDPNYNTKIPESNDGETIMNENYDDSRGGQGTVTSATDTTLVDVNKTYDFPASRVGWFVTIIQGPGVGQTRLITGVPNTDTLTVSPAWDVNPTTSSNYTITKFDNNYLVKDNDFQEVNRAIWLCYSASMENVSIVGNEMIDTNGIYILGYQQTDWLPGRFNVLRDILVEGNVLTSVRKWYAPQVTISGQPVGGTEIAGNHFYNVAARGNSIAGSTPMLADGGGTGYEEGYNAAEGNPLDNPVVDNDSGPLHGIIFDGNTASNLPDAYRVNSGSYSTTIWNSVNNGVGMVVGDFLVEPTSAHASVGTVAAWSTTSNATPPIVSVTAVGVNPAEGTNNQGKFRFTRNGTSGALNVYYTVSSDSAVAGDFTPALGAYATIASGSNSVDVNITAVDDGIIEGVETLTCTLTSKPAYKIGNPNATLTIDDNDMLLTKQDIGAVEKPGSFSVVNGEYTVKGAGTTSGSGIQGTADAFLFASQPLNGDGSITARLKYMNGGNGGWQHVGVMIRESSAAGSKYVMTKVVGGGNIRMSRRSTLNGSASDTSNVSISNVNSTPRWLRLTRAGQVFTAEHSVDGVTWLLISSANLSGNPMGASAYAGLAVSGITDLCTAKFDSVTVTDGSLPYSRAGWVATASHNSSTAGNALDGSASTRWTTGIVQAASPAQWYRLNFGSQKSFSKLVLDSTGSPDDSPASYIVNGSNDGSSWTAITTGAGTPGITTITFPAQTYQYIRMDQVGVKSGKWWSIHELNVYP